MPQSTVLIISDDPDFARALTSRWQRERQVPNFITFGSNYVRSFPSPDFTIAIVGPVNSSDEFYRHNLLQSFAADNKPAIVVANSPDKGSHSSSAPTILTVPQTEGWIENVIALALLMLDRCEIESRLRQLEEIRNADSGHATLGSDHGTGKRGTLAVRAGDSLKRRALSAGNHPQHGIAHKRNHAALLFASC